LKELKGLEAGILTPYNLSGELVKPEDIFDDIVHLPEKIEPAPDFSCFIDLKKVFLFCWPI